MSRKIRNGLIASIIFGFVSILFTVLVITVDVQPIGPEGTSVGFASMNGAFRDAMGTSSFLYQISNILGYLAILLGVFCMGIALLEWIRRKSVFRVDTHLIIMGFLLVTLAIIYIVFEKVEINYRPVLLDGDTVPEPSFPSSHTLLMATIFGACFICAKRMIRNKTICSVVRVLCVGLTIIGVLTRLFSGVHWLTDILAAVLYSGTLVSLYYTVLSIIRRRKRVQKLREESDA